MKQNRFWIIASSAALALAGMGASGAVAALEGTYSVQSKQRDDQGEARKEMKAGNQLYVRYSATESDRRTIQFDLQGFTAVMDAIDTHLKTREK